MDQKLTSFQLAHYKAFGFIQLKGVLKENELKAINSEFAKGLEAAHKYNPNVGSHFSCFSNLMFIVSQGNELPN